jgi:hypothetical protein
MCRVVLLAHSNCRIAAILRLGILMSAVVATPMDTRALAARWRELASDPCSPDFFELNEYGEVILSPSPSNKHELLAFRVAQALEQQLGPAAATAISVLTDHGVRRPDAVWMPAERWSASGYESPLPFSPAICVEVSSPGNTEAEVQMRIAAYLGSGCARGRGRRPEGRDPVLRSRGRARERLRLAARASAGVVLNWFGASGCRGER